MCRAAPTIPPEITDQRRNLSCRARLPHEISLNLSAPLSTKQPELLFCLDPFRCGRHAEAFAHCDDSPNDCRAIRVVVAQLPDEALIDFNFVEGEAAQAAE